MKDKQPLSIWSPFQQYTETFLNNPWTNWHRFFNPMTSIQRTLNAQFFPVHVNWRNYEDVGVEAHVLSEVGSYGKQLSIILSVLDVLLARLDRSDLMPRERLCLDRFYELRQQVEAAITEYRGPREQDMVRSDFDQFVADLRLLERTDPETYRIYVNRLQQVFAFDPAAAADGNGFQA